VSKMIGGITRRTKPRLLVSIAGWGFGGGTLRRGFGGVTLGSMVSIDGYNRFRRLFIRVEKFFFFALLAMI